MFAIIIPFYKLTFFEETLQSLANQTDKRFKVYIGDDTSPGDCTFLLEQFKGQFDFIYHRFETNLGAISLTKQWERCIALSEDEEWLMVLGDDDVLGENVVEEFYGFIQSNESKKIDLIRFNLNIIDGYGALKGETFEYEEWESSERLLERMFAPYETITASEFAFKRQVYNLNNGFVEFPLAWFSDYATWLLYSKKMGVYNLSAAKVFWRLSGLNISSKSTGIKEIDLKIASLFLFINFLHENFEIKKVKSKEYLVANLGWHLDHLPLLEVISVLKRHVVSHRFKYSPIIFLFVLKKMKKRFY